MTRAIGGTETIIGGYRIHTFLASGTLHVTKPGNVEVLVVAGGGSGGSGTATWANSHEGGGGGAGGVIHIDSHPISVGSYDITIGLGGIGEGGFANNGHNGENSIFDSLTAIGGGKGGAASAGASGGSGGGGTYSVAAGGSGVSIQGNNGGSFGGGVYGYGGGGGGAGEIGDTDGAGQGGDGLAFDISGVSTYYAGGGGGAVSFHSYPDGIGHGGLGGGADAYYGHGDGENGDPNTGGGGAGNFLDAKAGDGGSGVVIIKYLAQSIFVDSISPVIGNVGDLITITGSGFFETGSVLFSDNVVATVVSFTDTEIIAVVPAGAIDGVITVVANNGSSDSSETEFKFIKRFWVGDTGYFDDVDHWATSSGGTGGASMPTEENEIIIDENSFTMTGQYIEFR
jgi:hypothetical protein